MQRVYQGPQKRHSGRLERVWWRGEEGHIWGIVVGVHSLSKSGELLNSDGE